MACNCCAGNCPECVSVPNTPCTNVVAPIVEYECILPAPTNRSVENIGNRYGDNLFAVCAIEDVTFEADQIAELERLFHSVMVYFHGYSTLNTGTCGDDRIMYGRDEDCASQWMGGIYPSPVGNSACAPTELLPLEEGCATAGDATPVYRQRWTPTLDNDCCQIAVVDENGDPVLDADDNPTFEAAKLMFGAVPSSHAYLTEYGGTPSMPIDFDRIDPASSNKIVKLLCKALSEIKKAAA